MSAGQLQVIVAEDEPVARLRLVRSVQRLGHTVRAAVDGAQAWAIFIEHGADVIITDWMMPGVDGPELCRRVRAHTPNTYTYVIFSTALDASENVKEALARGADDYLVKPTTLDEIEARLIVAARVTALYRERAESVAHRETLVQVARDVAGESDDDPDRILSAALARAARLLHVDEAVLYYWDETAGAPTSARSSGWSGSRSPVRPIDTDVRTTLAVPLLHDGHLLAVLEVGRRDATRQFSAIESDTLELLGASMSLSLVAIAHSRMLLDLATTDPLTGLSTRRSAMDVLKRYVKLADRDGKRLTLATLKIDHFKDVNSLHGRAAGDAVLRRVAELLAAGFGSEDVLARWGGEELVVGAYDTPREAVLRRLTAIQNDVRQTAFTSAEGKAFNVTFSAGIAATEYGCDLLQLYSSADGALIAARAAGRDRLVSAA